MQRTLETAPEHRADMAELLHEPWLVAPPEGGHNTARVGLRARLRRNGLVSG